MSDLTPELLDEWMKVKGCSICGYVPVNNQGRCAKHKQPGDTAGTQIVVSPAQYKIYKEAFKSAPSPQLEIEP